MDNLVLSDWLYLISALGVIVALIGNVIGIIKNRNKEAARLAGMEKDIKHIREKVDTNDVTMKSIDSKMDSIDKRLVAVESSTRQAHKRIDEWRRML